MSQNIYDNARFFECYSRLPRSRQGLDGAPEWSTLQTLLPPLDGLRVLDLGCGYGWFCRWAIAAGAQSVVGVDLSEKMLARAKADTHDERITYILGDLEAIDIEPAGYDLVFSSLTLHDIRDLSALVKTIRRGMSFGGRFVFSVEHPVLLAPTDPNWTVERNRPFFLLVAAQRGQEHGA